MHSNPRPGSVIAGRYRLVRVIGEGGMGVVLEAVNITTERRVAVKWLHPSIASHPEAAQRLIREATATCKIRHPNVVDVYDVVRDGEGLFLIMELLEGEPLGRALERGELRLHELVALLLGAMRGVAEAHRLGIVHRDVHPANIFLATPAHDSKPIAKVLDFGISKMGGNDGGPSLTRSGTTLGTPLYMSYEQLCNARDVDERSDVYSFGVVLYEALTGSPPFEGESFAELAVKIASATPVPPKQRQPSIPTALDRIIMWAMARERDQRVPNLNTLIRELEPFASEHSFRGQMTDAERALPSVIPRAHGASDPPPVPAQGSERPPARRLDTQGRLSTPLAQSKLPSSRRSRQRVIAAALLLLVGAGVAAALLRGGEPSAQLPTVPQQPLPAAAPSVVDASVDKPLVEEAPTVQIPIAPMPHGEVIVKPPPAPPRPQPIKPPAPKLDSFRAGHARPQDF